MEQSNNITVTDTLWGKFRVIDINLEDTLINQITYITCQLWTKVRKVIWGRKYGDFTESRAYLIGDAIEKLIAFWDIEVKKIKGDKSPVSRKILIKNDLGIIDYKIEFGSHKQFIKKLKSKRGRKDRTSLPKDIKINLGFCRTYYGKIPGKHFFSKKPKYVIVWIGIKTTDPEEQTPRDPVSMVGTVIHELIHLIDTIDFRFKNKTLAIEIVAPIIQETLSKFFTFEITRK